MKLQGFFSVSETAAFAQYAMKGMQTPVTIQRRTVSSDEEGDDLVTFVDVTPVGGLNGWIHSTPAFIQRVDSGMLVTANTFVLYLPLGTDVQPGDMTYVGGEEYTISDTTEDNTWKGFLRCALRGRE
jgi:hypothetical protein